MGRTRLSHGGRQKKEGQSKLGQRQSPTPLQDSLVSHRCPLGHLRLGLQFMQFKSLTQGPQHEVSHTENI